MTNSELSSIAEFDYVYKITNEATMIIAGTINSVNTALIFIGLIDDHDLDTLCVIHLGLILTTHDVDCRNRSIWNFSE